MKQIKLLCCHFEGSKQSLCDQRLLSGGEVLAEVVGEHFRNKKVILKRPRSRTALVYEIVGKSRDGTYLFRASNQRGKAAEDVFVMGLTSAKDRKSVIRIIEGDMGAMDNNENTMRAMCAAYSAEIIAKPKHKNFKARYGDVIAESTFNRYLRQKDSIYNGDGAYGTLLEKFKEIKGRNS